MKMTKAVFGVLAVMAFSSFAMTAEKEASIRARHKVAAAKRVAVLNGNGPRGYDPALVAKKTTIDPITVSRAQIMVNTKRLLGTTLFTSNVVDEVTGSVTEKEFVQYRFRQGSREWTEEKPRVEIAGRLGPRRYSKLKLLYAAEQAGKAGQLKTMLESQTTPSGLTLWDLFNAAMYLREDDQNLMAGLKLAVDGGLCTQEQLNAILQAALD